MADAQRLIVRAPNWLGDAVMALPAIAALRRHTGGAFVLAAQRAIAPLFEEETGASPDEIVAVEERRELEQLRAAGGDAIVLLPNSFGSAWTARRAGIRERMGYAASGRRWLLTRAVRRPRQKMHQVDYYRTLVQGLGIEVPDEPPRVSVRDVTRKAADVLLRNAGVATGDRVIGFAPGAAYGHAKQWPPVRVAQVIAELTSARGVVAVLLGAGNDRATGREIESSLPAGSHVVNLIGRTTLRTLAGVIARCAAFVSNDSGAMHVAAALGVPLTAIFGPTDERATSPASRGPTDVILRQVFCRPCMLRECPIDHRCMKRISVDDVAASVARHLDAS